jgi:hypothetical protein
MGRTRRSIPLLIRDRPIVQPTLYHATHPLESLPGHPQGLIGRPTSSRTAAD